MRKVINKVLWVIAIALNFALLFDGAYGFGAIGASLLSAYNADPSMGMVENTYTNDYLTAWAESKGIG